jgi:hypothetical protein
MTVALFHPNPAAPALAMSRADREPVDTLKLNMVPARFSM